MKPRKLAERSVRSCACCTHWRMDNGQDRCPVLNYIYRVGDTLEFLTCEQFFPEQHASDVLEYRKELGYE